MASMLLDARHQPSISNVAGRGPYKPPRPSRGAHPSEIPEEPFEAEADVAGLGGESSEAGAMLGESMWQTSPGGLSKENSMATKEPDVGVLGLISQFRQTQPHRRGGGVF
ncbi:hypothetical protein TrVGV298_003790 [Trichoderma virens]|nr:hypothetical protein TrVGV298_003790 [Trichoderma virens]